MATEIYVCFNCGERFNVDDAESKQVYAATLEEPAEYEDLCPVCDSNNIDIVWDDED